jgi:hypothetical protein
VNADDTQLLCQRMTVVVKLGSSLRVECWCRPFQTLVTAAQLLLQPRLPLPPLDSLGLSHVVRAT